jgi:hypothetical protein
MMIWWEYVWAAAEDYYNILTALGTVATFVTAWATLKTVREMREERLQAARPLLQLVAPKRNIRGAMNRRGIVFIGKGGPRPALFSIRNDGPGAATDVNIEVVFHELKRSDIGKPISEYIEWDFSQNPGPLMRIRASKNDWSFLWNSSIEKMKWYRGLGSRVEWEHIPIIPSNGIVEVGLSSFFLSRICAIGIAESIESQDNYSFAFTEISVKYRSGAGEINQFKETIAFKIFKVNSRNFSIRFMLEITATRPSRRRTDAMIAHLEREEELIPRKWVGGRFAIRSWRRAQKIYYIIKYKLRPPITGLGKARKPNGR